MNEQEKAIVRTDCDEVIWRMGEMRSIPGFWTGLSETRKTEYKLFLASMAQYRNNAD